MASLKAGFLSLFDPLRLDESLFNGSAMTRRGALAAIGYMACAVLLLIFNKAALSSFHFPSGNVITICQIICSCTFLYILRRWKIVSFSAAHSLNESDDSADLVPFKTLVQMLPIALSYLLYMVVSMESVHGINVPMYTTLRRTAVAFTMATEYLLTRKNYSFSVFCCVSLIVFGAIVAGARDLSFDYYSYGVIFICNLSSAIYVTTVAHYGKSLGLNSFGLIWCNGIISGPILLCWTFFRGDLERTIEYPYLYVPAFQDFFTVILGWMVFGGLPFDPLNVIGQCIGFAGACSYAYCKLQEKQ
ncbi:hypothetical protein Sjap_019293 [Stephania japonica]|uniref:Sugar phosphate transporter domain-containing protein n=1 Tax=Stephania japonica TaxID=461633 RepID=A0AAP0F7E3_9MAGN